MPPSSFSRWPEWPEWTPWFSDLSPDVERYGTKLDGVRYRMSIQKGSGFRGDAAIWISVQDGDYWQSIYSEMTHDSTINERREQLMAQLETYAVLHVI